MKKFFVIVSLAVVPLFPSGGYDHGTATGKGLLELDFTWNPFNYFDQGQSYLVLGYGLTDRFDLHGYYSIHTEGFHTYYVGLFYQFLRSNRLDLATAVGLRTNRTTEATNLFFPQLLYTVKLTDGFSIGGSFVNISIDQESLNDGIPVAMDIFLHIPLQNFMSLPDNISDIKLALGLFNPVTNTSIDKGQFIPTYSLDFKFRWP